MLFYQWQPQEKYYIQTELARTFPKLNGFGSTETNIIPVLFYSDPLPFFRSDFVLVLNFRDPKSLHRENTRKEYKSNHIRMKMQIQCVFILVSIYQ